MLYIWFGQSFKVFFFSFSMLRQPGIFKKKKKKKKKKIIRKSRFCQFNYYKFMHSHFRHFKIRSSLQMASFHEHFQLMILCHAGTFKVDQYRTSKKKKKKKIHQTLDSIIHYLHWVIDTTMSFSNCLTICFIWWKAIWVTTGHYDCPKSFCAHMPVESINYDQIVNDLFQYYLGSQKSVWAYLSCNIV